MAYELINGAHFLHIPKTGGRWIRNFLEENNLLLNIRGGVHANYDQNLLYDGYARSGRGHLKKALVRAKANIIHKVKPATENNHKDVFRFCFVRHPLSWYESHWKYMKGRGWNHNWGKNPHNKFIRRGTLIGLWDDDFNTFIHNVICSQPGFVTELYFAYAKPGISFIGKTENLRADLQYVLDVLGLKYDHHALYHKPKANVSQTDQAEIQWDPQLRKTMTLLELPAFLRFNYLNPDECADLGVTENIKPHKALARRF